METSYDIKNIKMHNLIGFDFNRFNEIYDKTNNKKEFIKKVYDLLNIKNWFLVQRRWEKLNSKKVDQIDFIQMLTDTQVEARIFLDLLIRCESEKILF